MSEWPAHSRRSLFSASIDLLQKCTCHVYNLVPGKLCAVPGVAIQVSSYPVRAFSQVEEESGGSLKTGVHVGRTGLL